MIKDITCRIVNLTKYLGSYCVSVQDIKLLVNLLQYLMSVVVHNRQLYFYF
ncbi:hypothetical protein Lalb_Chr17g0339591 [Lupinus albus]|uniref:Uncharacterized protein n=1 Tax=Lupinus albus TaxID=3870 RepID=A0A6A4P5C5_LUPAL|nr:hypothetical protein Lalb_Chr17g0339591 [Lupinus albus]